MKIMIDFFTNFNWESFEMKFFVSTIFLILNILLSILVIPYFTLRLLKKKRKKFIITKISYLIQEFCDFTEKIPFKNQELTSYNLSIYTAKKDIKNHRFIGIINLNLLDEITHLKMKQEILNTFNNLTPNLGFDLITKEKNRLNEFKTKLETIISFHSLDIDETIISEVSLLCIEIRAFEIKYKYNSGIDDLIEKGLTERTAVFGVIEISNIYKLILNIFEKLLKSKLIDFEIEKK
ncbi:hypothetical protein [Tenacibaculum dicentrarchi]|uniref:hypothetical protein n=1 Tax=Tenacibaculum dicentrarchi TaxID=669041 RepID=UPI003512221A